MTHTNASHSMLFTYLAVGGSKLARTNHWYIDIYNRNKLIKWLTDKKQAHTTNKFENKWIEKTNLENKIEKPKLKNLVCDIWDYN